MDGEDSAPPNEFSAVLYIGQHETQRSAPVASDTLSLVQDAGYDMLTTPVSTSHFQSRVLASLEAHVNKLSSNTSSEAGPPPTISALTSPDTTLAPEESNLSLIAFISPWIDLASPDPLIAHVSRQILNIEVAYAAFCGINNMIVAGPISNEGTVQYARAILEALSLGTYVQLHILSPMSGELEQDVTAEGVHLSELARKQYTSEHDEGEVDSDLFTCWETWNTIRTICSYHPRLSIALEFPRHLPPLRVQLRWYSEPVRIIMLPRTTFLRNAKGYPVLSRQHQQYLTRFRGLRFAPWILLSDIGSIAPLNNDSSIDRANASMPTPSEAAIAGAERPNDPSSYLRYVRHLQQSQPPRPPIDSFAAQGYYDYLQSPLQPLTENLESITYEVFEKDPVKYERYESAIALALRDLSRVIGNEIFHVAVLGAGRGPLVTRALLASRQTGVKVRCWAVEKNPNACVLLQRRNATDQLWNNAVTVVKSDMRSWPGPLLPDGALGQVDIFVSELLGSFADNELSPECLDGVQHFLHPDHGISIPKSYSAHLTPITSPKLYSDLQSRASNDLNMTVHKKWEIPYVVMLFQYDYMSLKQHNDGAIQSMEPDVRQCWSFTHPAPAAMLEQARRCSGNTTDLGGGAGGGGSNRHNARSSRLTFTCQNRGVCHGLAGYFEAVLYRSPHSETTIELSTNPLTMGQKSKDLISWFPIFFPLKAPLYVPDDAVLEVSLWRQTDDRKVWYEWVVEVFEHMHGKARKVGTSELHSSRRNGCMM